MESLKNLEHTKLRKMLRKLLAPTFYVCASENAKEICHKNYLSPAELLRPFGILKENVIGVDGLEKRKSLNLANLNLDFVDAEEYVRKKTDEIEAEFKYHLEKYAPDPPRGVGEYTTEEEASIHIEQAETPWFDAAFASINNFTKYSFDCSFLDLPVGIITVISVDDKDAAKQIQKLNDAANTALKQMFTTFPTEGASLPRICIVIYESSDTRKVEDADKLVQKLQHDMGSSSLVKLIIIGSSREETRSYFWDNFVGLKHHYPKFNPGYKPGDEPRLRGCYINKHERDMIGNVILDLTVKMVIPFLESRIRNHLQVYQKKKNFMGSVMKGLFKKTQKTDTNAYYPMIPEEASLRLLADTLFFLEDYEAAVSVYKCLIGEIKSKSHKLHGSCKEMTYICHFLWEGGSKKEISFEETFKLYLESWEARPLALRSVVLHYYAGIINNRPSFMPLIKDSSLIFRDLLPLFYPLLCEQYALSFLKIRPIKPRKYAFWMIITGHAYNQLNFRKYGLRCYALANILYDKLGWNFLKEHINNVLGKNSFVIGEQLHSLKYFRHALTNMKSEESIERHQSLLKEIFDVISYNNALSKSNKLSKEEYQFLCHEILKLPLPKVIDRSFDIVLSSDLYNYINDEKFNQTNIDALSSLRKEDLDNAAISWDEMGEKMTNHFIHKGLPRLTQRERLQLSLFDCRFLDEKATILGKFTKEASIGEKIKVFVRLENPFKVELDLKNIHLLCELEDPETKEKKEITDLVTKHPELEVFPRDLKMDSVQVTYLCLEVAAYKEGILRIKGIKWNLRDFESSHEFNFKKSKVPKSNINETRIVKSAGNIKLNLQNFNHNLVYGEFKHFGLTIENPTEEAIETIYIVSSLPICTGFETKTIHKIEPKSSYNYKFYLRGSSIGTFEVRLLLKTVFANGGSSLSRLVFPLAVGPSFLPKYFATSCFNKRAIGIQIEEFWQKKSKEIDRKNLTFTQFSVMNDRWTTLPIGGEQESYKNYNFFSFYIALADTIEDPTFSDIRPSKVSSTQVLSKPRVPIVDDKVLKKFFRLNQANFDNLQPDNAFTGKDNREIASVAIFWEYQSSAEDIRSGCHFIFNVALNPAYLQNTLKEYQYFEHLPLSYDLGYQREIEHDFHTNIVCTVEIKLKTINTFHHKPLHYKVEVVNPDVGLDAKEAVGSEYFQWKDKTEIDVFDQKPTDAREIVFRANFFGPGLYDLSRFKFVFFHDRNTKELVKPLSAQEVVSSQIWDTRTFAPRSEHYLLRIKAADSLI